MKLKLFNFRFLLKLFEGSFIWNFSNLLQQNSRQFLMRKQKQYVMATYFDFETVLTR